MNWTMPCSKCKHEIDMNNVNTFHIRYTFPDRTGHCAMWLCPTCAKEARPIIEKFINEFSR